MYGEINIDVGYFNLFDSSSTQFCNRVGEDLYLYNRDPAAIGVSSEYNITIEYTKTTD